MPRAALLVAGQAVPAQPGGRENVSAGECPLIYEAGSNCTAATRQSKGLGRTRVQVSVLQSSTNIHSSEASSGIGIFHGNIVTNLSFH